MQQQLLQLIQMGRASLRRSHEPDNIYETFKKLLQLGLKDFPEVHDEPQFFSADAAMQDQIQQMQFSDDRMGRPERPEIKPRPTPWLRSRSRGSRMQAQNMLGGRQMPFREA